MPTTIDRLKVIFLALFAVSCVITWTYHFLYVWPRHQCEQKGDWWDNKDRVCAVPMPIWQFTGRGGPHPQSPAVAAAAPPTKAMIR
jgi:hypothetical protein